MLEFSFVCSEKIKYCGNNRKSETNYDYHTSDRFLSARRHGLVKKLLAALVFLVIIVGCSDEKIRSGDPGNIKSKKSTSKPISRRSGNAKAKASKSKRFQEDKIQQTKKRKISKKSSGSNQTLNKKKRVPARKQQPQQEEKQKTQPKKDTGKKEPVLVKKQVRLRKLFRQSQPVFQAMTGNPKNHRLSWKMLNELIEDTATRKKISIEQKQYALQWIEFLEHNSRQLKALFSHPHTWESLPNGKSLDFVRSGNALLTPVLNSMWRHCKLNFENRLPGWQINLISGYHSPAYEAFLMTQSSQTLDDALRSTAPPYYNRHQRAIPDITLQLSGQKGQAATVRHWELLHQTCKPFGFTQREVIPGNQKSELGFVGVNRLYHSTFSSKLIPEKTKRNFFRAMQRTGFYPSPDGLRVLFAISAQESSVSWNPRLNKRKKDDLKKKFDRILENIENAFGETVSELFFSAALNQEKLQLVAELERITNPKNRHIREYDFYLWTLKVRQFLNQLLEENQKLTRFGQWFFKIEQFADQIQYEPQTFGLWQINVNHLIERIQSYRQLRRRFPEIYIKKGEAWEVNRGRLIDVLSGMPTSILDRQRTLELIIHTYLQPRYQSHLLGHANEMMFFIAENVAGEMSTYRAAIQRELNIRIGSNLVSDGDLSFYYPYSTRIDWNRPSNTQNALYKFIQKRYAYFSRPVDDKKLVMDLCKVKTWGKMRESELYRRIMRKKRGQRAFPQIKSELYQQTPLSYARIVLKKSQLF